LSRASLLAFLKKGYILRKKRRRDARKRILSALGVRGTVCQREMSAFQRTDGTYPPYGPSNGYIKNKGHPQPEL
jgi:hypothetical protein